MRMESVHKRYGPATVLANLDLKVGVGEVVTVKGINGSGKSTLLRIAATLTTPTAGTLNINGTDAVKHAADARRHIGAVMHSPMLYSDLTVRENLSLFATLCQLDNIAERVEQVASRLALHGRMDERVRRLSHGYRKRVAIARAIIHTPSLLLLDEPETGLDAASLEAMMQIVNEWKSKGRAVLIATHSSEFVADASDTAYRMSGGRLHADEIAAIY